MAFGLHRWRWQHLLGAWVTYWAGLALVTLGPFARAAWRITQLPEGHGTISAGLENTIVRLVAIADGVTVWTGSAHLTTVALWVAGPPLLIWLAWLARRPRRGSAFAAEGPAHAALDREPAAFRGVDVPGVDRVVVDRRDNAPADRVRDGTA